MKTVVTIFGLVLSFVLFGCQNQNEISLENKIEKSIDSLIQKHPQLKEGKGDFHFLKSVKQGGKYNSEILLYSQSDSLNDPQQILVFIDNNTNYISSIPFFSNTYRDFWDFYLEEPIRGVSITNTTFEKEINRVTKIIKDIPYQELFYSVLNCKHLVMADSLELKELKLTDNLDRGEEDLEKADRRLERNTQEIKSDWYTDDMENYSVLLDSKNGRIYKIGPYWRTDKQIPIQVFRQDAVFRFMTL